MPADLPPERILDLLKRGQLGTVYLFYGPGEFRIEKVLSQVREDFIPEAARDFNLEIFYGGEQTNPGEIIDAARSLPFLSPNRLIIVRRTESFPSSALESFVPYIDTPVASTCLIFISSKADFRKEFYKKIRGMGNAVHFKELYDRQVLPWIKRFARELGLNITQQGCTYLQGIVGNRLRDLYTEMEKLYLRHGSQTVGEAEIQELAIHSRIYSIFELMDQISLRRRAGSMAVLNRYIEEEGKEAAFGIVGMLNRQIRLIIQAKSIVDKGGRSQDVTRQLRVAPFLAKKLVQQARHWRGGDLEHALYLLYRADRHLKSGSQVNLILENLVLSI
ncbi:MAG: DNA polymerase III subunit delta [Deltaproteobacteria bacterium]|jgi:DNA polymerase-3 subunit delta|nr:DNA polymerase III subunit delta [Deltaproteobacteria bacterium]